MDITSSFTLSSIEQKSYSKYSNKENSYNFLLEKNIKTFSEFSNYSGVINTTIVDVDEIIKDISKILIFLSDKNQFLFKYYDPVNNCPNLNLLTKKEVKDMLSDILIYKDVKTTLWNILNDNFDSYLKIAKFRDFKFVTNERDIYQIFSGWKFNDKLISYDKEELNDMYNSILKKINIFLQKIKYLAGNNDKKYLYLLDWISYVFQNPGRKNNKFLVFSGLGIMDKLYIINILKKLFSIFGKNIHISKIGKNEIDSKMCTFLAVYGDEKDFNVKKIKKIFEYYPIANIIILINSSRMFSSYFKGDDEFEEYYIPARIGRNVECDEGLYEDIFSFFMTYGKI